MKAIMLAAGEGVRMRPLTEKCPKPLLRLCGKPLLEHILERMPEEVDEFIIVVGYLGDMIKSYCGEKFLGRPVRYFAQPEKSGTFRALELAHGLLKEGERFIVIYGDDLHGGRGIRELLRHDRALLVHEVEDPRAYGVIEADKDMMITRIVEKPERPASNLISSGVLLLDTKVFRYTPVPHHSGEYFLPEAVAKMIADFPVAAVRSSFWFPITTPEQLALADAFMLKPDSAEKLS